MDIRKSHLAEQSSLERYGMIVGLYGDPANQDITNKGTSKTTAFTYITMTNSTDPMAYSLFWSRLLLVEFLMPHDSTYKGARLGLVLRPRSLWLYQKSTSSIADFVGNSTDPSTLGSSTDTNIVEVNPPYRLGDVILCGTLPAPIELEGFTDGFTRLNETYDGTAVIRVKYPGTTSSALTGFTSVNILAASYNSTRYNNLSVTQVLSYDKNVDARTRIVSGAADSGKTVNLNVCVGGINQNYTLKGTRNS